MNEYDRVQLIAEKPEYVKEGVHNDMEGIILSPKLGNHRLVCFDGKIYQDAEGVYRTTEKLIYILEEDLGLLK